MAEWIQQPVYNITAPALIVSNSSRLNFIGYSILSLGTAGSLTLNDAATLAQASAANEILTAGYSSANVGISPGPNGIKWPCMNGLVVSQVPTGMVIAVCYEIFFP